MIANEKGKRFASVSIDLDNKWSYLKTRGDKKWESLPSYFDLVVPRVLEFLNKFELTITFFVVGTDADQPGNAGAIRQIVAAGHEIGNHSYLHEPWLHLYSRDQIVEEFAKTEKALERITGRRPIGFRGPGFSFSRDVLSVMQERGYRYDCSTFPTFLGPLARAYYFFKTNLDRSQKEKRKDLFGSVADGFQRLKPFRWNLSDSDLLEIPVTTIPIFKIPFHLSYIMFLAKRSETLAIQYFRFALLMCRLTGVEPSILLHPLDFLGCEDDGDLSFFPAMDISYEKKSRVLHRTFECLTHQFQVTTMARHAAAYDKTELPVKLVPARS